MYTHWIFFLSDLAIGTKSIPVIAQSESIFNAEIIFTESNYDISSQLMEMHIVEWEKLSYIRGKTKTHV